LEKIRILGSNYWWKSFRNKPNLNPRNFPIPFKKDGSKSPHDYKFWSLRGNIFLEIFYIVFAPFLVTRLSTLFYMVYCRVYVMSIGHDEDMKSKFTSLISFEQITFLEKWKHCVISILRIDITIVSLFFQKKSFVQELEICDTLILFFIMADDLIECCHNKHANYAPIAKQGIQYTGKRNCWK